MRPISQSAAIAVSALPNKGRAVVATTRIPPFSTILTTTPIAQVLKKQSAHHHCAYCLAPSTSTVHAACAPFYERFGGEMLSRVDLTPLEKLHAEDGRKFPLLIANLLASLLAEIKATRAVPSTWEPLELVYATLHEEAETQVASEHAHLLGAFADAGLADARTLEMFLPLDRYKQLLGAAQLNAFELTLSHGAVVSALLPGTASMFNHACEENVLVRCGETHEVSFVTGELPVEEGEELCISYVDGHQFGTREERRHLLLHKYGFECECARCRRGE